MSLLMSWVFAKPVYTADHQVAMKLISHLFGDLELPRIQVLVGGEKACHVNVNCGCKVYQTKSPPNQARQTVVFLHRHVQSTAR